MKLIYIKRFVFVFILLLSSLKNRAQIYEKVQNGHFISECGTEFWDAPCNWVFREYFANNNDEIWENVAHIGRTGIDGFVYSSLGTCDSSQVTGCNFCSPWVGSDFSDHPPLNTEKTMDQFGIPTRIAPGNCVVNSSRLLFGSIGPSQDNHCLFMAPGYGSNNKGGIETHLGNKLRYGDYILSFDLAIPFPALNMAFNFEVYLNSSQNDKDEQIFKLSNATGATMEPGVWKHFEKVITIDKSDDKKYEWLSLINERCNFSLNHSNAHVIFIDNVSFIDKCMKDEGPCSPFLGEPDPHFEVMPNGNSVCVSNLGNIKYFNLKISSTTAQDLRTIIINNPAEKVCWDQKTDAGVTVTSGIYSAQLEVKTACLKLVKSQPFTRQTNELVDFGFIDYSEKDKLGLKNCCNPNIIIANEIIDNVRDYIGPQKITLGPNVTIKNTANVLLQAGVNIEIIEPIFIEENAIFEARIGNCTAPSFKRNNLTNAIDSSKNSKKETINWFLSPNPSSTNIKIRNYDQSDRVNFIIYDMHGKEVFKMNNFEVFQTIDISNFAKGVYYLNLIGANGIEVKKFIKY